jgi:hypothetical protein
MAGLIPVKTVLLPELDSLSIPLYQIYHWKLTNEIFPGYYLTIDNVNVFKIKPAYFEPLNLNRTLTISISF